MKRIAMAVVLAGFLLISRGFAQDRVGEPARDQPVSVPAPPGRAPLTFRSQEYGGFVTGQAGNYGNGYTINGVSFRSWFLGAGAGLDFYRFRTIPVFLSLEKEWLVGGNGLFTRVDAGLSLPWQELNPDNSPYFYATQKLRTGGYWNAVAGYKIFINARHRQAVLISAGYSFKQSVIGSHTVSQACPLVGTCNGPDDFSYTYSNRRAIFNLGFQF